MVWMHRILFGLLLLTKVVFALPLIELPPGADALVAIKKKAEAGERSAQTEYASELYRRSKFSEAERWYMRAARQGDPKALCELGEMYHQDRGFGAEAVKKNFTNAIALHQLAAALGYQKSHFHLGFAYKDGKTIPKDKVLAYQHFKLSGRSPTSDQYLKGLILEMTQAETEKAEGLAKRFKPVLFERAFEDAVFGSLQLGGTLRNKEEYLAVLNGELATQGSSINVLVGGLSAEVKLIEIRSKAVVAVFGGAKRVLSMPVTATP